MNLLVSKIHIGARRREKVGSLASLKVSLERVGQIHPITVRPNGDGFDLVAGQRRLRAAEAIGWKKIRARVGKFTDEQLREIELDENQIRLDLGEFEAGKARLRQIEPISKVVQIAPVSGGRGKKGGDREIARRTGFTREEIRRTKRHVAAAEEYPVFQGSDWKRSQVLAADEALESMPKRDRALAIEMVAERGVPPETAVTMIETLAEKPAAERKAINALYRSGDPKKHSLAMTRAAKLPPMPDERLPVTREILRLAQNCLGTDDDLEAAYEFVIDEIEKIIGELLEAYEKQKGEG